MAEGSNNKCVAVGIFAAAMLSLALVARVVAPLEAAALTAQIASTAAAQSVGSSSPSSSVSITSVLGSLVGQVLPGTARQPEPARVYRRERLRLVADPTRLRATGMATVRYYDDGVVLWSRLENYATLRDQPVTLQTSLVDSLICLFVWCC
jgi:hypothetical protein